MIWRSRYERLEWMHQSPELKMQWTMPTSTQHAPPLVLLKRMTYLVPDRKTERKHKIKILIFCLPSTERGVYSKKSLFRIFLFLSLTRSLLQYGNFRSWRSCAVINNTQPFEITPPPSTMTNVNRYANTFSIFTDKSRHAWFAIEPLSILSGGSRKTSHPFVGSPTVRWLIGAETEKNKWVKRNETNQEHHRSSIRVI